MSHFYKSFFFYHFGIKNIEENVAEITSKLLMFLFLPTHRESNWIWFQSQGAQTFSCWGGAFGFPGSHVTGLEIPFFIAKDAVNEHLAMQHHQDMPYTKSMGLETGGMILQNDTSVTAASSWRHSQRPNTHPKPPGKPSSTWMPWAVPWAAFRGRETLQRSFRERAASSKICCTVWVLVERPCRDACSGTCTTGLETFYILYFNHYENVILINGFNPAAVISYWR